MLAAMLKHQSADDLLLYDHLLVRTKPPFIKSEGEPVWPVRGGTLASDI